jgi:hypothetical protein
VTALSWRTAQRGERMAHAMPRGTFDALCGADPVNGWARRPWTSEQACVYLAMLCPACERLAKERVAS